MKIARTAFGAMCRYACVLIGEEDVEQELLWNLRLCAVGYDPHNPTKASFDTYYSMAVRNLLYRIIHHNLHPKRKPEGKALVSGSKSVGLEENSTLFELIGYNAAEYAEPSPHLKDAMRFLSPRERQVIDLRFGLSDGISRTLDECKVVLGITRERIRQLESKIMAKLWRRLRANGGEKAFLEALQ